MKPREILQETVFPLLLSCFLHGFRSSSRRTERSSSSGTFLRISPFLISRPSPIPPAIPISASLASPGPLTTQPITATFTSRSMSGYHILDLVGEVDQVDLGSSAGRTGNYFHAALSESQSLQDQLGTLYFLHGITGQGNADRIADALMEDNSQVPRRT